ncbi:uncharacterized protein LOC129002148 [Macrosteles quadrilineatus]|uniref:uncharacterized protein LOC129002148 n=1 Tax=Macrosteles quadrilineatus TaxID=74068 RepID=UPI0023E12151|nr:uncharacterized protein LOC129002148 [Macrosteles quadrilineatus]
MERWNKLEDAENALPSDVSCLKLLLEWNLHEGKGKTHEKLSLRLRQIGRQDLASWLDSAVLDELQGEIDKLAQEFSETPQEQLSPVQVFENDDYFEQTLMKNDDIWDLVPTVTILFFIAVSIIILTCFFAQVMKPYRMSKWEKDKKLNHEFKYGKVIGQYEKCYNICLGTS